MFQYIFIATICFCFGICFYKLNSKLNNLFDDQEKRINQNIKECRRNFNNSYTKIKNINRKVN